jgi:hypothetical protein
VHLKEFTWAIDVNTLKIYAKFTINPKAKPSIIKRPKNNP